MGHEGEGKTDEKDGSRGKNFPALYHEVEDGRLKPRKSHRAMMSLPKGLNEEL